MYAALGPQEGTLDWMVAEAMNTDLIGVFLSQVGMAHPDREVDMVLDGLSPSGQRAGRAGQYSTGLSPALLAGTQSDRDSLARAS